MRYRSSMTCIGEQQNVARRSSERTMGETPNAKLVRTCAAARTRATNSTCSVSECARCRSWSGLVAPVQKATWPRLRPPAVSDSSLRGADSHRA